MKKRFVHAVVYLCAVLLAGSDATYAQQSYASLLGQISDRSGAGVAAGYSRVRRHPQQKEKQLW